MNITTLKYAIMFLGSLGLGWNFCNAQTNRNPENTNANDFYFKVWQDEIPPGATNWGKTVQGIKLSISTTNSDVEAGASIIIAAVIKNESTNSIALLWSGGNTDFDISLTNGAGKLYHLTPRHFLFGSTYSDTVSPGEHHVQSVPVGFGTNIAVGDYTLKATRKFWLLTNNDQFNLESNELKVHVK